MNNYKFILIFSLTLLMVDVFGQSNSSIFKSILEAEYSGRKEPVISRDSALINKLSGFKLFNESGKLIEHTTYESKELIYEITKISWSKDSLVHTSVSTDSDGKLKRTWESKWNKIGQLTGATNTNSEGLITTIQTNTYDEQGNMILRRMESVQNGKIGTTSFTYNSEGNVVEKVTYNPYKDRTDKRTYEYDELGNEVKQELFKGNGDYTRFVSEYDEIGNVLEDYWYDSEGILTDQTSFTYEYDRNGNWTTKTRGSNGKVTHVWERRIEYW